jgi:DNA mismatch repair protein MutS
MTFHSILFDGSEDCTNGEHVEAPAFFADLNLDQLIESITADWKDYDLAPFYFTQLKSLEAIAYRQYVMQDLGDKILMQAVKSFSGQMRAMQELHGRAEKLYYKYAIQRCFVGTVEIYCKAVERFSRDLCALELKSPGLCAFRDYLTKYVVSASFSSLVAEAGNLKSALAAIRYCLLSRMAASPFKASNRKATIAPRLKRPSRNLGKVQ